MKIGHKIKKIREIKGFTREYMAAQLEMSVSNYGKLERDEVPITLDKLHTISESLDINYLDILSFDEKQVFNIFNTPSTYGHGYVHHITHNGSENLEKKVESLEKKLEEIEKLLKGKQD